MVMNGEPLPEKRKVYTSFHDLSPGEYMYIPKGSLDGGKPGSFSKLELLHLFLAIVILTAAFSFTLSQNNVLAQHWNLIAFVSALPVAFLGLVTAFFVHELSHKFWAQRYGLWSEFRMYPRGLVLSFFLAFFTGFVFAAPGAVMFRGETRSFETGRIAAAGPSANIVIGLVTYGLYRFIFFEMGFWGKIFGFICLVNVVLATFNLLPFGPLDGRKVMQWNGLAWSVLFSGAVILLVFIFVGGIQLPGF